MPTALASCWRCFTFARPPPPLFKIVPGSMLVPHLVFISGTRDRHHSRDNKLGFKRSVKLRVPVLNRNAYEPANPTVTVFGAALMFNKTDIFYPQVPQLNRDKSESKWLIIIERKQKCNLRLKLRVNVLHISRTDVLYAILHHFPYGKPFRYRER